MTRRSAAQRRWSVLSVIVLSALEADKRPDPFFMLAGGPGDAPSFNARFFSRVFDDIRKKRDIVLVDLRGTGKSSPLFCPELGKPGSDGIFDADQLSVSAVRACRARLEKTTDLTQYTTEIAVDDLEEVRQRLGYGPINLYGTSYGSRVAQVYMRRYPNSIRAVAMKGIVPPSMAMPEAHASAGEAAWQALLARCRKDAACTDAYPLVAVEFRELLKRLEANPVMTLPASRQRAETRIRVSRGLFAEAFRNVLYTPDGLAQAPKLIHQLVNGDDRGVAETALSGPHRARRRTPRRRILPVGDLRGRPSLLAERGRREGRRNVRRELPARATARRVQGMAKSNGVERAPSTDEVGDPNAVAVGRIRSGHAAGGRRRSRSRASERPAHRDPQQRPSDRQR